MFAYRLDVNKIYLKFLRGLPTRFSCRIENCSICIIQPLLTIPENWSGASFCPQKPSDWSSVSANSAQRARSGHHPRRRLRACHCRNRKSEISLVDLAQVVTIFPEILPPCLHIPFGLLDLPLLQHGVNIDPRFAHLCPKIKGMSVAFKQHGRAFSAWQVVKTKELRVIIDHGTPTNFFSRQIRERLVHRAHFVILK